MCEGVGEDSRRGIGYVDIQVGSCIYLSVIVYMTYDIHVDILLGCVFAVCHYMGT